jgi:hypothetical protein
LLFEQEIFFPRMLIEPPNSLVESSAEFVEGLYKVLSEAVRIRVETTPKFE